MNLNDLNREQRLAAETLEGPLLVLAGAGSGKTRTLTYRVANLIDQGVPPWSIMAITFTNKAASEMRERIEQLVGERAQDVWVSTFHAGCARILRRDIEKLGYTRSFTIYDDEDAYSVIRDILKHLNLDEKTFQPRWLKSVISDAKNRLLGPQEWFEQSNRGYQEQIALDVYTAYEERLKSSNALDFDDLLVRTLDLLTSHPPVLEAYQHRFRYIHVDEYQDTNAAQYMLVRLLAQKSRNLCVVGDDDQSIYSWRGADLRNILDFEKDFPDAKVIKLEQNYRSTANILDAANQVIAVNENRKDKALWTQEGPGEPIRVYCASDEHDEASWVCQKIRQTGEDLSCFAVLYRANSQSRVIEEAFVRTGIRYRVYGGQRFYDRKEIKDILAYLRVMINPADDVSVRRIINVPKRAIGDTTLEELTRSAQAQGVPLLTVCMDIPETLPSRARNNVGKFAELMLDLTMLAETMKLTDLVRHVIDVTGLERQYAKQDDDEARSRVENIREFLGAVQEYEEKTENASLSDYLENVALITDLDAMSDDGGVVTMMTLHSAKGLEFQNVFIVGMEENLFPSSRSFDDPARMEEERRLCYVGITRARKRLYLSYATRRMLYNQMQFNERSRFLDDIPPRVLEMEYSEETLDFELRQGGWHRYRRQRCASGEPMGSSYAQRSVKPGEQRADMRFIAGESAVSGAQRSMDGTWHGHKTDAAQKGDAQFALFSPGDHVEHKKFGRGVVIRVQGQGAQTKIMIRFDDLHTGVKEFMLSVAPIVKIK